MIASETVGMACPTLRVPGMSSSSTMRPSTSTAVVVANEPMPRVSKKFAAAPSPSSAGIEVRRVVVPGAVINAASDIDRPAHYFTREPDKVHVNVITLHVVLVVAIQI